MLLNQNNTLTCKMRLQKIAFSCRKHSLIMKKTCVVHCSELILSDKVAGNSSISCKDFCKKEKNNIFKLNKITLKHEFQEKYDYRLDRNPELSYDCSIFNTIWVRYQTSSVFRLRDQPSRLLN